MPFLLGTSRFDDKVDKRPLMKIMTIGKKRETFRGMDKKMREKGSVHLEKAKKVMSVVEFDNCLFQRKCM